MPITLSPQIVITPLSPEVFVLGKGEIIGCIEDCTFGLEGYLGRFLVTQNAQRVFSHPTLFASFRIADTTAGWVIVSRDNPNDLTQVTMRPYCMRRQCVPKGNERVVDASLPAIGAISVEAVLLLAERIRDAGGICANRGCDGARDRTLDLRRTVLLHRSGTLIPLCAHCYDKEEAVANPDAAERVIIDGRRLPMRAPVAYLSAASP